MSIENVKAKVGSTLDAYDGILSKIAVCKSKNLWFLTVLCILLSRHDYK